MPTYTLPVDTTTLTNGPHYLDVEVLDELGNTTTVTLLVYVNNPVEAPAAPAGPAPGEGYDDVASFNTWPELRLDILDRAEEETGADESEFYAFVSRAADRAYEDILNRRAWLFARARRPLILRCEAPITTTITWASGAYTATLGAAQSRPLSGWKVRPAGSDYAIRVYDHMPGTADLTLEAALLGDSLAGVACVLFKDEYDLAEIQELPAAPTVGLAGAAGGVTTGLHGYRVTFVSANGETLGGPAATVTIADPNVDGTVTVAGISLGPPGTIARRIYRTRVGDAIYRLLATIPDNLSTAYVDTTADATLAVREPLPDYNTTGAVRHIIGLWTQDGQQQIDGPISEEELREQYDDPPSSAWPPSRYARLSETRIRFSEYPDRAGLVEVVHTTIPRDLSETLASHEILVPRTWRWLIADGALFYILDIKHDSRTALWGARFEKGIEDLMRDDDRKRLGMEGTRARARREPAW